MKNFIVRKEPKSLYLQELYQKKFNDHLISIFSTFSNAYTMGTIIKGAGMSIEEFKKLL